MKIFVTILVIAFLSLLTYNGVNFYLDQEIGSFDYWRVGLWSKDFVELKEFIQSKYDDDNKLSNREFMEIRAKYDELEIKKNKRVFER